MSGKIEMADVVRALEKVRGAPVLTSNQCWDLAQALNAAAPVVERQPVAVVPNESAEFNKWWNTTEVLKKNKLQIAQEAWQARACLDKVKELNQ